MPNQNILSHRALMVAASLSLLLPLPSLGENPKKNFILDSLNDAITTREWERGPRFGGYRVEFEETILPNMGEETEIPDVLSVSKWISGLRFRELSNNKISDLAWFSPSSNHQEGRFHSSILSPSSSWVLLPYLGSGFYFEDADTFSASLAKNSPSGKAFVIASAEGRSIFVQFTSWLSDDRIKFTWAESSDSARTSVEVNLKNPQLDDGSVKLVFVKKIGPLKAEQN